jgi:hypothetical protein
LEFGFGVVVCEACSDTGVLVELSIMRCKPRQIRAAKQINKATANTCHREIRRGRQRTRLNCVTQRMLIPGIAMSLKFIDRNHADGNVVVTVAHDPMT